MTRIDGKKFYSLGEIVRLGLIPGVDTIVKASRLVKTDAMTSKILRAKIVPLGNVIQYKVKGENIINYLVNLNG